MKSYNHLYEKFIEDGNKIVAIHDSARGKKDRRGVREFLDDEDGGIARVDKYLHPYRNSKHKPVQIYDGITRKKRVIIVPKYYEQVVHHMVVNTLRPIIEHGMYEHSYASIPGRGAHQGKKAIEKWIRRDPKNCKYCLKMDIRKFFDSIPHDILLKKMRDRIHDERFMEILEEIISVTDRGLPLGFYTSQWLSNWYLQDLDHYIKEQLRAPHYIRYMDDMVVFGSNKRKLHRMRIDIDEYLQTHLGLQLKDNWQVFRFDYIRAGKHRGRMLDYMGFRFYRDRTTMRRSIMLKATRKARRVGRKEKPTVFEIRQMLSYIGWIGCTNAYNMYLERIKPYVNVQNFKRRISRYDKSVARKEKENGVVQSAKHKQA